MVTSRDRKSSEPRQKIPNIAQTGGKVDVCDPRSDISGSTSRTAPHVQVFMNDGPNPLT